MAWSIILKAALAGLFVSVAAGLLSVALRLAGVPLGLVRVLVVGAGAVAAVAVGGVTAQRALEAGMDLLRARAHGVFAAALAGLFIGLLGWLDAAVGLGVGAAAGVLGWLGTRYATARWRMPRRRDDPGWSPDQGD